MTTDLVRATDKPHNSIEQLMKVSQMLADGKMFFNPNTRQPLSPGEVFSIVEYGREVGLEPVMSLQNISIVNGRLCMGGAVMLGIAKQHGVREEILQEDATACEIRFERPGHMPYTTKFTMEDAKRIKVKSGMVLADKDVWKNYPAEMLKWRTVAKGLRVIAADLLAGLYLPEEIENIADAVFDYTPLPEAKQEHFDQKKNGFLDDDAPVIVQEVTAQLDESMGESEKITESQLKAYWAVTGGWHMNFFQAPFKQYLSSLGMLDETLSIKSLTKEHAIKLLSKYPEFYKTFMMQDYLHEECKEIFTTLESEIQLAVLTHINSFLSPKMDVSTIPDELDKAGHFSLFCLALANQTNNEAVQDVSDGVLTTDEAIAELESLGMEPTVVDTIDLSPKQNEKPANGDGFF